MTAAEPRPTTRRRGGPPVLFAVLAIGGLLLGVAAIGISTLGGPVPGAPATTVAPAGAAAAVTAGDVTQALGAAGVQAQVAQRPFRPPEAPALFDVPRVVLQAILPDDPEHGYIVVYELATDARADAAGRDYAAYIASGPGRVQFPNDAHFVLRRVGSTLVAFFWSPGNWPDPRSPRIEEALTTLGEGIPVPS